MKEILKMKWINPLKKSMKTQIMEGNEKTSFSLKVEKINEETPNWGKFGTIKTLRTLTQISKVSLTNRIQEMFNILSH